MTNKKTIYYGVALVFSAVVVGSVLASTSNNGQSPAIDTPSVQTSESNIQLVDGPEFRELFKNTTDAVLLDVRTPAEYDSGFITGAINIDFQSSDFASKISELDREKTYFVYCRSGNRTARAIAQMKQLGFANLVELDGGIVGSPDLLTNWQ